MKKRLILLSIVGFVLSGLLGVLLHFLYGLSGESRFVALFSAVNESTFEHMKILFFPLFLFAFIEKRFLGDSYRNFWCARLCGILLGIFLIPVLFYTLGGIFGTLPAYVNITIFFVADAAAYALSYYIMKKGLLPHCKADTALLVLFMIAAIFAVWTFVPPRIPLFMDPVGGGFGVN